MSDERLKVLSPKTFIFSSNFGVFGTVAVQDSGFYFVEDDTWKFRTTSNDGRVVEISSSLRSISLTALIILGPGTEVFVRLAI
jgi:hypothetical protein